MALSQRPASRFFAAFYRWNQHTRMVDSWALKDQLLTLHQSVRLNVSSPVNIGKTLRDIPPVATYESTTRATFSASKVSRNRNCIRKGQVPLVEKPIAMRQ